MKKHSFILIAVTILALAAMSCNIQFSAPTPTPTPAPAGPLPGPDNAGPGNPIPQGPDMVDPENPVPQGPGPNPNEGQGQIVSFTADRTTLNKGECAMLRWETQGGFGVILNEQPVERSGQQQVCPPQATIYALGLDTGSQMLRREVAITVNGGNQNPNPVATTVTPNKSDGGNKPITPTFTPTVPGIQILPVTVMVANLDLAISNIYPSSTGNIMVTVKNTGNVNVSGSYKISCTGYYKDKKTGTQPLKQTGQYAPIGLAPGKSTDFDTSFSRNPDVEHMYVECTLTPPQGDTNSGNNKMGPTQVK